MHTKMGVYYLARWHGFLVYCMERQRNEIIMNSTAMRMLSTGPNWMRTDPIIRGR